MPPSLVHLFVSVSLLQHHAHTHKEKNTYSCVPLSADLPQSSKLSPDANVAKPSLFVILVNLQISIQFIFQLRIISSVLCHDHNLIQPLQASKSVNLTIPSSLLRPADVSSLWFEVVLTLLTCLPSLLSCVLDISDSSCITDLLQSLASIQFPLCYYVHQPLPDPSSAAS